MVSTISKAIGAPIPNNTEHAVSVTLPTWEATVGYEEGKAWVVNKMHSGYPRFFIHSKIQELAKLLELRYARDNEKAFIFPGYNVAKRCRNFIKRRSTLPNVNIRILQLSSPAPKTTDEESYRVECNIAVVFLPSSEYGIAKQYWQHAGEGISSRLAEYFLSEMKDTLLQQTEAKAKEEAAAAALNNKSSADDTTGDSNNNINAQSMGPSSSTRSNRVSRISGRSSRSSRSSVSSTVDPVNEYSTFIEERFGRNLDLRFANEAKMILKKRIFNKIKQNIDETNSLVKSRFTENEVYFFPSGMAAIFSAHQLALKVSDDLASEKSVCFGFPYVDTLNILRKWGSGVHFYGFGDNESLDDLEKRLKSGERILSLLCECPSNPLLKTPNLERIKKLADEYNFYIIVDDTVGNFSNINVLPYCDMVVSSLTKVFSGDSNVMAGSLIISPYSSKYDTIKNYMNEYYEDYFWAQDAIYLERNSRDFEIRSSKINDNSLAVLKLLQECPIIKDVFYPYIADTKEYYDALKNPKGGYGGLISIVFKDEVDAVCFFNRVELSKGPSLGTNFTLICPYSILAHFQELDEIEKWGVDRNLVRISVGLEPTEELLAVFKEGLDAAIEQHEL